MPQHKSAQSDLPWPDNVGKIRKWKAIDETAVHVKITGEIQCEQGSGTHSKLICLQRIQFESDGHIEYRFTYYMVGVKAGRTKDKWVFGQYSLVIPAKELKWLLKEARKQGWVGFV
jgi:hypothetical protein